MTPIRPPSSTEGRSSGLTGWRNTLHELIYEADTAAGRWFDIMLFFAIFASIAAVMLESVPSIRAQHGTLLRAIEWFLHHSVYDRVTCFASFR